MRRSGPSSLRKLSTLHRDTDGAVLLWVSILMLVVFALIGLAIDGARFLNLNSNLQEVADAAAIAGAKELDGSNDAITRAINAALNYLQNNPRWSDVAKSGVQIDHAKFYDTAANLSDDVDTTDPRKAVYIRVWTVQREASVTFSVVSNVTSMATNAVAVAKSSFSVCAQLQSFVCNPWESEETTNQGSAASWKNHVNIGDMLALVGGSNGAPGNWGLIQAPAYNSNPHNQAYFWSLSAPGSCPTVDLSQVGQDTDTGNNAPFAVPGMNVRFDNPQKSNKIDSTAAPIVIDGFKNTTPASANNCANSVDVRPGGAGFKQANEDNGVYYQANCNESKPRTSCPLPRDRTLTNLGGNAWSTSLKGNGVDIADLKAYWLNQHGSSTIPEFASGVATTTRWQVYQMESNPGKYPGAAFTNSAEDATPQCKDSLPAGDIKRRVINVAIVDCDYWDIKGSATLPVTTLMASFFMTEPADANGKIYGELINTYQVNGGGSSIYQIVQLVK
ncbi:MAG: pilus assembly protein TadG-related protein [Hyphomicrobiales bacterium]